MRTHSRLFALVSVVAVASALLMASCSSTTSPPASQTSAQDTKPYGTLTTGLYIKATLDPLQTVSGPFQAAASAIFDSLVELSPEAQPRPGIAERWEISPDGKAHTFYIRKGVKFHNGDDLIGADVKFSLETRLDPKIVLSEGPQWRAAIDRIELKDDYTVVMYLKQPLYDLLVGFETLNGLPVVMPKKYIEEKGWDYFISNLVGSGPWKVVNNVPGARFDLEAVENHWRAVPKFKNATLLFVPEEGTKVAMLKTGELDISEVAPDSVPALKSAGLRIVPHDGAAEYFMFLYYDMENPDKWAFGNVKVRKAMSLAMDRREMADKLYGGYAEPDAVFYLPKTSYFFDPNVLKPDPFDPEGAKKLVAEAGYPNGFSAKIWDMGGGVLNMFNSAVAGYWRKVGANTALEPIDVNVLSTLTRSFDPKVFNTARGNITGGAVFQFEKMATAYHSTKSSPKNLRVPRLDELIDKVPVTRDPAEKKKLALEAAVLAKNEYSSIGILNVQTIYAVSSKVGEFKPIKSMTGLAPVLETITHSK